MSAPIFAGVRQILLPASRSKTAHVEKTSTGAQRSNLSVDGRPEHFELDDDEFGMIRQADVWSGLDVSGLDMGHYGSPNVRIELNRSTGGLIDVDRIANSVGALGQFAVNSAQRGRQWLI